MPCGLELAGFQHLVVDGFFHTLAHQFLDDVAGIFQRGIFRVMPQRTHDHVAFGKRLHHLAVIIIGGDDIAVHFDFCLLPVLVVGDAASVDFCDFQGALPHQIGGRNPHSFVVTDDLRRGNAIHFHATTIRPNEGLGKLKT